MFELQAPYQPAGDQPRAISELTKNLQSSPKSEQVLLGVTGSGKTYSLANVIKNVQLPTLVIAHNKTLAAQLYQEFRDFFPNNAVSYFVSYYDYYQPEAYIASSDTYIEKESEINDEIDKLRLATTANLLSRPDCIVVASVSCIYNLGSPEDFFSHTLEIVEGEVVPRSTILRRLTDMQYQRTTADLTRGSFRIRGERIQIWPANEPYAVNLMMPENTILEIERIDPVTGDPIPPTARDIEQPWRSARLTIYPAKHYIARGEDRHNVLDRIERDMRQRVQELKAAGKVIEAARLEQRTVHDIDMIRELGFVNGIENYSTYFDGREPGEPPFTLLEYFRFNAQKFSDNRFLTIIDESHMTLPQIRGMHAGDRSRKETLVEYGFRLPSALDNRPLQFPEFQERIKDVVYVSATPSEWELQRVGGNVVEQIVRPTGLTDPPIEIRPVAGQIPDLLHEIIVRKRKGQRVLVTTLTKRMAETLTEYLNDRDKMNALLEAHGYEASDVLPKAQYLHSDVQTLERSDILDQLRRGDFDVLIGVNLLREGLDLPEVTLVAILDADQEGFLRSDQALIQTMGRAARHAEGFVLLYADRVTGSMQRAIDEVSRRREIQLEYNRQHGITPQTIVKPVRERLVQKVEEDDSLPGLHEQPTKYSALTKKHKPIAAGQTVVKLNSKQSVVLEELNIEALTPQDAEKLAKQLRRAMNEAAKAWNFELAARLRDTIAKLG